MTKHIDIEELKGIYKDNREGNVSDSAFAEAVEEINGRVDNFIDALLEDILQDLAEGAE
jgi:predicted transcriptional regulator